MYHAELNSETEAWKSTYVRGKNKIKKKSLLVGPPATS